MKPKPCNPFPLGAAFTSSFKDYLANCQQPSPEFLQLLSDTCWDVSVVIPARQESEVHLLRLFKSLREAAEHAHKKTFSLLIWNSPASHPCELPPSFQFTETYSNKTERVLRGSFGPMLDVFVIDRSAEGYGVSDDWGVGHARKLGCDIICQLFEKKRIKSEWLRTTDADAEVAVDYFADFPKRPCAYLYPFRHETDTAHMLYEKFLNYYVEGLEYANSPYAFHTIGSTLAIRADAYAAVRGFPPRLAAEDFYILNKLRKIGPIETCPHQPITLCARQSERVPFGTGVATKAIDKLLEEQSPYEVLPAQCFTELKLLLESFPHVAEIGNAKQLLLECKPPTKEGLEFLGYMRATETLFRGRNSGELRLRSLHEWFDAFRTRKFLHYLRDNNYPPIPLKEATVQLESIKKPRYHGGSRAFF